MGLTRADSLEQKRNLTVLDVMITIAATAGGLAVIRGPVSGVLHVLPSNPPVPLLIPRPALNIALLTLTAWPLPAMWTLALLTMTLRAPRPSWHKLSRQPGVIACYSVVLVGAINALLLASLSLTLPYIGDIFPILALPIGLAVAVAWMSLLLVGQWWPVSSLFDRAGRVLGAYWVAMIPLSIVTAVAVLR
jgi:hypothetical protein